jgi:outer membrane biosynthesis protein TonB
MLPTNPLLNATAPAGPHLPVALLRQYAAGTLAPAAQHRVEAHTLACPRCNDILEGLLQGSTTTTDQALAQLQQRLRMRVQQQAAPARLAPRQPRWLALQLAAAAALLLGLVAGGWLTWQQRHPTPSSAPAAMSTAVCMPPASSPPAAARKAQAAPAEVPPLAATTRRLPRQLMRPTPLATAKHRYTSSPQSPRQATVPPDTAASTPIASTPPPMPTEPNVARAASAPQLPASSANSLAAVRDSNGFARMAVKGRLAVPAPPEPARVRVDAMPAGPAIAPAPSGGYSALREKLRREAAEFVPEGPEGRLSGTVQLRLTIGADGKIQEVKVLRGLRADYDEEAQRLVCEGPNWVSGISGGRRAPQKVDVAVPFQ